MVFGLDFDAWMSLLAIIFLTLPLICLCANEARLLRKGKPILEYNPKGAAAFLFSMALWLTRNDVVRIGTAFGVNGVKDSDTPVSIRVLGSGTGFFIIHGLVLASLIWAIYKPAQNQSRNIELAGLNVIIHNEVGVETPTTNNTTVKETDNHEQSLENPT